MEKEKLKDKMINFIKLIGDKNIRIKKDVFDSSIIGLILFFATFYLSLCISKNLFLLLVINIVILLTSIILQKNENNIKITTIKYLYLLIPTYSLIYISNIKVFLDIFLWLFLLIIFSKIANKIFNNTLENVILENSRFNNFIGYLGSLLIGVLIGLISALLLKQKIIFFIIINILIVALMILQDKIFNKSDEYLNFNNNKFLQFILYNYNNLSLTSSFIGILLITNIIIVK